MSSVVDLMNPKYDIQEEKDEDNESDEEEAALVERNSE